MTAFRVALSADFRKPDGSPSFPTFDLSPLEDHPDIDLFYLSRSRRSPRRSSPMSMP